MKTNQQRFSKIKDVLQFSVVVLALVFGFARAPGATFYQGVTPATVPWPGGVVPYQFDADITPQQQEVYLDGMREWELAANIHFVPHTTESNYVILRFFHQKGTNTYVASSPAVLTIDSLARSQICHETGHLLGFQHEHVRTNRDDYITVNFSNLQTGISGEGPGSGGISNLYVIDTNATAIGAYDFESVMHYGRQLFAADPNVDVLAPQPPYVSHYYHRIGNLCVSPLDRAGAAYLYGPPTTPLTNIVTTTADVGFGSLRAAIYYANDHPGTTIQFNIPTSDPNYSNGVYTIYLTGELPPLVADGTIIDATTQPGFAGKPVVAMDGKHLLNETGGASGIYFYESRCTIRGLAIQNVTFSAVEMLYNFCASNHVEGCFLGLAPDGTNAAPNGFQGVNLTGGAHGNIIGGTNASQRNVLSGDIFSYGITITETNTDNNVVEGNYIGLDASGASPVSNGKSGVGIFGGPRNTIIGGTNTGAGNVISGNTEYGIFVGDPATLGTVIQGNYIGTDAAGNLAISNNFGGIAVFNGAHGVTIGGTVPAARNIISGNETVGIYILGDGASNNIVQGNFVGLNAAGNAAVPNAFAGIYILGGAQNNLIGGTQPGAGNIISGNFSEGIYIANPDTTNNSVVGNRIGTDTSGTARIPNGFTGIGIWDGAQNNFIGGANGGAGNLISGNGGHGVSIGDTNTSGNVVQGNLIGTTPDGLSALFNGYQGVNIQNGASGNMIGGSVPAARNIISGNAQDGVHITDPGTSGNQVLGNYIGLNINGTASLPNQQSGVAIVLGASANLIGTPVTRNVIAGNGAEGIYLSDAGAISNVVQGNYIGVAADGTTPAGNSFEGIIIRNGAQGNIIGFDVNGVGAGNLIANSGLEGVAVYDNASTSNTIRGNAIFNNTKLGINLAGGPEDSFGVTADHSPYLVVGPNHLQNFPVITNASVSGGSTVISGTLNSAPNRMFQIDLYRNSSADPSGHGEGQVYLGSAPLTTDSGNNGTFSFHVSGSFAGQLIAATATDTTTGDTSEFSTSVTATNGPAVIITFVGPFARSNGGFGFNATLQPNISYRIQATTNLTATNAWVDLTNFTPTTSPISFTDPGATNLARRFYRIVTP